MIAATPPWEAFLADQFPGYLLPASQHAAIDAADAARVLERLTGRADLLFVLRATSLLAPRMPELREFALSALPSLVRSLTARTHIASRVWEGGFQGRLDIGATLAYRLAGKPTTFVTRSRERRFDRPEDIVVRAVATRLLAVLGELRRAAVTRAYGWSADAHECEGRLRHTLESTVLREVPDARVEAFHLRAASSARHPCYAMAARWYEAMAEAFDDDDPARIAEVVARGALAPISPDTRFEIAVALRLLQALEAQLCARPSSDWRLVRTLVLPGREELATFERRDGARIGVYYNQSVLPAGTRDLGVRHYFAHVGRLRPDLTVLVQIPGEAPRAVVVEIKHSAEPGYLVQGFEEAVVYRAEYTDLLTGWPKVVLVTSSAVRADVRPDDDVIVVDWDHWVPELVLNGLATGL